MKGKSNVVLCLYRGYRELSTGSGYYRYAVFFDLCRTDGLARKAKIVQSTGWTGSRISALAGIAKVLLIKVALPLYTRWINGACLDYAGIHVAIAGRTGIRPNTNAWLFRSAH